MLKWFRSAAIRPYTSKALYAGFPVFGSRVPSASPVIAKRIACGSAGRGAVLNSPGLTIRLLPNGAPKA